MSSKDLKGRTIAKRLVFFINVMLPREMDAVGSQFKSQLMKHCGARNDVWRISGQQTVGSIKPAFQ